MQRQKIRCPKKSLEIVHFDPTVLAKNKTIFFARPGGGNVISHLTIFFNCNNHTFQGHGLIARIMGTFEAIFRRQTYNEDASQNFQGCGDPKLVI